jgi:hypothetical protein
VQHIAGWYTSCGMFFPEGSGPTKRDRLGPAQLLNNLSLTPQQNPGGMVYPPTPPIPLPFCEGNPYPCQGVGVLEGKGKGKDLIPWGYPCHSLHRNNDSDVETHGNKEGSPIAPKSKIGRKQQYDEV